MVQLTELFEIQKQLQSKLGNNFPLHQTEQQQYINLMFLALQCETAEALSETAWKNPDKIKFGWKQTNFFNEDKLLVELIDMLHFYINICLACGFSADDITNAYLNKNKINEKRKENGY